MIKTKGAVWEQVNELLMDKGIDTTTLKIASFGRGTYHEVVIDDSIIGGYDHKSKRLTLAEDLIDQQDPK